jgi:hypothetical protein
MRTHPKLKMTVELDAFRRNIAAYQVMTGKTAAETVRDVSLMVLQTGANSTKSGAIIPIAPAKRDVLQYVRRYRHGVEELVQGARPEAPGDKPLWLIPRPSRRRPIGKTGGHKFWTFESAREAREHASITYRGVGRAGFWAQYPALGENVPKKVPAKQLHLAGIPGLTLTVSRLDDPEPTVTVSNRSVAVQRLADAKTPYILSRVTNRIAGIAKANKKLYLSGFKAAGGVVYRQTGVMNGETFGKYEEL